MGQVMDAFGEPGKGPRYWLESSGWPSVCCWWEAVTGTNVKGIERVSEQGYSMAFLSWQVSGS